MKCKFRDCRNLELLNTASQNSYKFSSREWLNKQIYRILTVDLKNSHKNIFNTFRMFSPNSELARKKYKMSPCPVNASTGKEVRQFSNGVILTQTMLWGLRAERGAAGAGRTTGIYIRGEPSGCCRRLHTSDVKAALRKITWKLVYSPEKRWADDERDATFSTVILSSVNN